MQLENKNYNNKVKQNEQNSNKLEWAGLKSLTSEKRNYI